MLSLHEIMSSKETTKNTRPGVKKYANVELDLRPSGIGILGDIPWGSHFSQFYKSKQDLLDILVPYFKAGLEGGEFCVWVTSDFLTKEDAIKAMRASVPSFDEYLEGGQMEIFPYTDWYVKEGKFEMKRVMRQWLSKYKEGIKKGYAGLRVSGNPFWINNKKDWDDFAAYESQIDDAIRGEKLLVLCTYSLEKCSASEILDVVQNHQFALIKRGGDWEVIETSEEKKTKTALREIASFNEAIARNMGEGLYTIDVNGLVTFMNPASERLFGWTFEELRGKKMHDITHHHYPDGRPFPSSECAGFQVLKHGRQLINHEDIFIRKDGTFFNVAYSIVPMHDAKGKINGLVVVFRDIFERKKTERQLRTQHQITNILAESKTAEEATRGILKIISEAFGAKYADAWIVDRGAKALRFVDAWSGEAKEFEVFKEASSKFTFAKGVGLPGRIWKNGKPAQIFDVTRDRNFPRAPYAAQAGLHGALGFPLTGEGGLVVGVMEFFSEKAQHFNECELQSFSSLGSLIGQFLERKNLEKLLNKFSHAVEQSDASIIITNNRGIIEYVNKGFVESTGYGKDEAMGRNPNIVQSGLTSGATYKELWGAITSGKEWRGELCNKKKSGELYWDKVIISPIRDANGKIVNFIAVQTDITQSKNVEERRKNFLAILGHELRNPLAPMSLSLDLLSQKSINDPDIRESLDLMKRQTSDMALLINDLLDISRIERGKIELNKKFFDLALSINGAAEVVSPMMLENQQVLETSVTQGIMVDADPLRLKQILANILSNASKYSGRGSRVELSAKQKDGKVLIKIRDYGIGIAKEEIDKIFNLFWRANNSKTGTRGGLGIGLHIARELARMHGGDISISSAGIGKGSIFTVTLPVAASLPGNNEPERETRIPRKKILVVDDNRDIADTMGKIVRMFGSDIRVGYSGKEALEIVNNFKPDVAFLDIGMPVMDGFELARKLKNESLTLVAVTGYGQEEDKKAAKKSGFDYYLVKPVGMPELGEVLSGNSGKFKL